MKSLQQTNRYRLPAAIALAALVALANFVLWFGLGSHPSAPDVTARVNGLTYAPFGRDEAPWVREVPMAELIATDLKQLASITGQIRTYSAAQFPQLPALAAQHGLQVTLGAWLNGKSDHDLGEIAATLEIARQNSNVNRLIIGNEALLKEKVSVEQLVRHLRRVRLATHLPVSTAEPWHVWLKYPELAKEVDFITIHLLPYWEGVGIETALEESLQRMAWVRERHPGKAIVIGEVGYPSGGSTIKRAVPSPAAQATFVRQFVAKAAELRLEYFLIEAFDQPWKQHEEGRAGAYWGMFDAARIPKFAFSGPVEPDPYWRAKALGSSMAGFILLSFFLSRLMGLRSLARIAFAIAAQAVLVLATVVITLPLLHYMAAGDWLMLALLIVTSAVMVAILLAHLFEFVELFWDGSLRRRFVPQPLAKGAPQPFVSIHLACCNEPPQMVIATLKSLLALDYKAFEVIVVDNNTRDEALWHPIRDFMATLPSQFRFFHLAQWPGFKAGALNFALDQTDSRATVIGVVDADYVVKPNWLRGLVGYFDDKQVGIVQAPQAHRDWGATAFRRMMNWEYEGFFRIGMHHRNERDAIIQHGTMTLIRAASLQQHGRWSEWCLCEDAELGLRLMQQDFRTIYVDTVMGEGLTPDDFGAFKKQRMRWAQGGIQILKAHWRALLGREVKPPMDWAASSSAPHKLSLGQRYHFIAGWLPWMGDALHLVFVAAALLWTIAVLAMPHYFALPIALFMLPLAMFCAAKLVIGPLLYWRRVPCSVGSIVGASLAGMALSHAIAKGVFAGIFTKTGVFQITAKGNQTIAGQQPKPRRWGWFSAVREETLLLTALLMAIAAVAFMREPAHAESLLWMAMLALQALPYVAALICAAVARLPDRQLKQQSEQQTKSKQILRPLGTGPARIDHEAGGGR